MVHVLLKPGLENFEHDFASVWDECNCVVVWTFFGIAFFWDWNENLLFQSCGHCWIFQISWQIESSTFTTSSFRIWNSSTTIPSPPLALFVDFLPKAHLTLHSRMSGSRWVFTPLWLSGGADVITEIKCTINVICFSHPETPTLLTSMKKMLFHETSLLCQKGWGPLLQGIYTSCSIIQLGLNLCNPMDYSPPRLLCPCNFPRKNTGVGCHFLLQEIFPTQGWNPRLFHLLCLLSLPHCRQILYYWATRKVQKYKLTLCDLMDCSPPRLLCP